LRSAPDDTDLLNRVGYFLVEQDKNLPEALQLIQRAVTARPGSPIFLHNLGWAYFKLGRYDEARRYLQESVKRDLYSPLSLEHLGDVYEQQGDKEGAKAAWSKALSFSTDANSTRRLKGKLNLTIRL
jgi:Tfp pilus assembly protein PilF